MSAFQSPEEFKKFLGKLSEEELQDFLKLQQELGNILDEATEAMREYNQFLLEKK